MPPRCWVWEACRRGYRVGFTTAAGLVNTLIESREKRQLKRHLAKLARFELLIVDEVGYIPFSAEWGAVAVSGLLGPLRKGFADRHIELAVCTVDQRLR